MISRGQSCLVLGGGGFLGTNLCRRLLARGSRVRALGRRALFPAELAGAEWVAADFSDRAALAQAIDAVDVVFHLIHGTVPQSADLDMAADLIHDVAPTLAMLDLCRGRKGTRVVFVSSGGTVYGRAQEIPTPETAPTEPITAYGISKLAIEKYFALHEHHYGLDFRILRVTNAFGPFQLAPKRQGIIATLIARALKGEPIEIWGDGTVTRDFIFVDDVLDALEAAAGDDGSTRIFNIGSGEGRTLREVVAAVQERLGRPLDIRWREGRSIDVPVSVVSIERAKAILGWTPKTDFASGLDQTISWWRALVR